MPQNIYDLIFVVGPKQKFIDMLKKLPEDTSKKLKLFEQHIPKPENGERRAVACLPGHEDQVKQLARVNNLPALKVFACSEGNVHFEHI